MKKSFIATFIVISFCGGSSETTTVPDTTTTTSAPQTTTTSAPQTTTTVPDTTTTTSAPQTTTTVPDTTTTTVPDTTTTTSVPLKTSYSLKFGGQVNQFPEIPYCKMQYAEVEEQLNNFFLPNNIKITIREFEVKTENEKCHGYVSGGNYSYLDRIENGAFVEITVEGTKNNRKFPTTIANTENAKDNDEWFYVFCDVTGVKRTQKKWLGGLLQPYQFRGNILYSQPNYANVNLTDPDTNCGAQEQLDELCFWRVDINNSFNSFVIYRNYLFDAINHYSGQIATVTNSCSAEELENKLNEE